VVEQGRQVNDGRGAAGGWMHSLPRRSLNLRAPGWKTSGLTGPGARRRSRWKTSGLTGPGARARSPWKTSGLEERARAREETIPGSQADGEPGTQRDEERGGESSGENEFQTHERRHSPERDRLARFDMAFGNNAALERRGRTCRSS